MLITKIEEIRALAPTAKWSETEMENLIPLIEEEEENLLVTILGKSLYDTVVEEYRKTADTENDTRNLTDITRRIIRACQRIVFYRMLANNSGIFSVSFNMGGGFNMMTTDNYEAADKEVMRRFERDAWGKSGRNIENLLLNLEEDARGEKLYTDKWKESKYFYYHGNLLFTTATELQEYLTLPQENLRRTYINLVPTIDLCQDTYIAPRIGEEMMKLLIGMKYAERERTEDDGADNGTGEEDEPESFFSFVKKSQLLNKLTLHVRRALANYVANETKTLRTEKSLLHADMQIALAEKMTAQLREEYDNEHKEVDTPENPVVEGCKPADRKKGYDRNDSSNVVLDLGGLFHS